VKGVGRRLLALVGGVAQAARNGLQHRLRLAQRVLGAVGKRSGEVARFQLGRESALGRVDGLVDSVRQCSDLLRFAHAIGHYPVAAVAVEARRS